MTTEDKKGKGIFVWETYILWTHITPLILPTPYNYLIHWHLIHVLSLLLYDTLKIQTEFQESCNVFHW